VLATLATAPLYIIGCAAAWRLARDNIAAAGAPLNFRWLGTASIVGIGSMLLLISLAARVEILGLLAVISGSVLVYPLLVRMARGRN
jgi:hypothetical protein